MPLSDLICPLSIDDFFSTVWGRQFFVSHGADSRWLRLFSWDGLSEVLSTQRFTYPRLRLVKSGSVVNPNRYITVRKDRRGREYEVHNSGLVKKLLEEGAMLHVASVGECWRPLAVFAELLATELGAKVEVNLHAGFAGSKGFDTHWDGHDVYVVQIEGSKHWRMFGITEDSPIPVEPGRKGSGPSKVVWEGVLNAGDALYIPRGYWHSAAATEEPTLHLTFAAVHTTGIDFLMDVSREVPFLRRDIPIFPGVEPNQARDKAFLTQLQTELAAWLTEERLAAYLSNWRRSLVSSNLVELKSKDE